MIQVENEIGMLEDARDHSPEANKLFNAEVPQDLKNYLGKNAEGLPDEYRPVSTEETEPPPKPMR